jgi:hypothetical protein
MRSLAMGDGWRWASMGGGHLKPETLEWILPEKDYKAWGWRLLDAG